MESDSECDRRALHKIFVIVFVIIILGAVYFVVYGPIHTDCLNSDAYSDGCNDGYTQYNETIYKYSTNYTKYHESDYGKLSTEYWYCKGYCDGHIKRYLETTKPEGMRY